MNTHKHTCLYKDTDTHIVNEWSASSCLHLSAWHVTSCSYCMFFVWNYTSQLRGEVYELCNCTLRHHLPVQVWPSLPNWYPSSHSQRKVPGWLLQMAWKPQIWGVSAHSSMSDEEERQLSYANNSFIRSELKSEALKSAHLSNQRPSLSDVRRSEERA